VLGVGHPQLVAFLCNLPRVERLQQEANTRVYMQRPNLVREVCLPGDLELPWSHLVLKRFGWRGVHHYLLSPLKHSKAHKAYRTACHLLAHGLRTPVPLGVLEERRWGFIQYNIYATEAIMDYITLRKYCQTLPEGMIGLQEVMRLAAAYTRRLHDSGLWHRDMVLANFLLAGSPGNRRLYVVDLNRARRLPAMPALLRAVDLARMEWREWQPEFCALYCAGRFSTARLLWIMHLYGRWRAWRRRVLRVLRPWRTRRRHA
jgi:hypothetical protein